MTAVRDHAQAANAAALAPGPGAAVPVRLPAIAVRTDSCEVAAFLRETAGVETSGFVPLTFPFRWLALPAIRGAILQMTGGEGFLPVHESQSFAYERSLSVDADYVLDVEIHPAGKPARLILKMAVLTGQEEICVRLETVLRIVRLAPETES